MTTENLVTKTLSLSLEIDASNESLFAMWADKIDPAKVLALSLKSFINRLSEVKKELDDLTSKTALLKSAVEALEKEWAANEETEWAKLLKGKPSRSAVVAWEEDFTARKNAAMESAVKALSDNATKIASLTAKATGETTKATGDGSKAMARLSPEALKANPRYVAYSPKSGKSVSVVVAHSSLLTDDFVGENVGKFAVFTAESTTTKVDVDSKTRKTDGIPVCSEKPVLWVTLPVDTHSGFVNSLMAELDAAKITEMPRKDGKISTSFQQYQIDSDIAGKLLNSWVK